MAYKKNSGYMSSPYGDSEGNIGGDETTKNTNKSYDDEISDIGNMLSEAYDELGHFNVTDKPKKEEAQKEEAQKEVVVESSEVLEKEEVKIPTDLKNDIMKFFIMSDDWNLCSINEDCLVVNFKAFNEKLVISIFDS